MEYLRVLAVMCGLVLVTACSGGGSSSEPTREITISPSLGKITNADVTITRPDGTAISGGAGTTGTSGIARLSIPANTPSPVVVSVVGTPSARYFDELLATEVEFPASRRIRAYARPTRSNIGVTSLTELASQVAEQVGVNVTDENVDSINEQVRTIFAPDVDDILNPPAIVDADNINGQALGTDEASLYALRLAALAGLGAGSDAPALSVLSQLSEDLSDGVIDGRSTEGAIENLNYDNFAEAFRNAIQLASNTLANAELLAAIDNVTVETGANLLQQLVEGGLELPTEVVDNISLGGTGNFDLTISGAITSGGIEAPFSATFGQVPAPNPSDSDAVTELVSSTVAGLTSPSQVSVEVLTNTDSQVTFTVALTASQGGLDVSLELRYDYVANAASGGDGGDSSGGDSSDGGSNEGGSGDGGTGDGSSGDSGENFCIAGEASPATIPEFLTASARTLSYTNANDGSPFSNGDQREFLFSSSGRLFVDNEEVAANPVFCGGNEREAVWKDSDQDIIYSVSDLQGSFNEININRASDGAFLGQFKEDAASSGPPSVLTSLAGSFETVVVESCSGEPCPNETAVGEIVTVIIGDDGTVTFGERVINTEAEGADFSDNLSSIEPRLTITNPGDAEGETFSLQTYIMGESVVGFELAQSVPCGSGCSRSKDIYTEVNSLPEAVTALFDKFVAASPTTLTVVADDAAYNGKSLGFTNTPFSSSALCRPFEVEAIKDRAAVESSRFRPKFSYFSGAKGGDDFLRRVSRYKLDADTGDEFLSFLGGQLVLRNDGTIDLEEGLLDQTTGFVENVQDRSTNDAAEIGATCADFHSIGGSVTSDVGGSVTIEIVDAEDNVISSEAIILSTESSVSFSFVFAKGTSFTVRTGFSSPTTLSCTLTNESGVVGDEDITNISVACTNS